MSMTAKTPHEARLLLIEKVLLLRSLSLFAETPETVLAEVAGILTEEEAEAGSVIFPEGELAQCMYIIFRGEVRIHKGDHTLAILSDNEFFGELSLLDTETRSATATAHSDTLLLKLDQEPFYEIMESRIEVARGVIKTLCKRIRELNGRLIEKQKSNQS